MSGVFRFLSSLFVSALVAAPAHAETLEEALKLALSTFPEIRSAAANRRAVAETRDQARSQRLPTVDAVLGQGSQRSDNPITRAGRDVSTLDRSEAEVTLSQLLFDGGGVSSQIRRQDAQTESASNQLAATSESVGLRVAQAYLEIMRLRQVIGIARENILAHQRTFEQVNLIVESGAGRRVDARQASARLALAQSSVAQLNGQLRQAESAYHSLTGRIPGTLIRPAAPDNAIPSTLMQAIESALARHPSVKAAQHELEASSADLEFARARLSPRLTLELGMTHNRDVNGIRGLNADQTAMLRLRQNLFRGGADAARIREAEARRDEAQALLARARNEVEREVRVAWENLAAERERLPQARLHASAASEVVEAYRAQFRIGQRSLLDVLNAENEYFGARSTELTGEYAVASGVYRLLASQARLLASFGLSVPSGDDASPAGQEIVR